MMERLFQNMSVYHIHIESHINDQSYFNLSFLYELCTRPDIVYVIICTILIASLGKKEKTNDILQGLVLNLLIVSLYTL